MEKSLADQLQDVIEALLVAESKARQAAQTIREQRLYFGLGLNHPDVEDHVASSAMCATPSSSLREGQVAQPLTGKTAPQTPQNRMWTGE